MAKILHISRDNKFLDFAIKCFEEVIPGENVYLVLSESSDLRFISSELVQTGTLDQITELVQNQAFISKFKAAIFHGISDTEEKVLEVLPEDLKVIWFGWGYDYYPLLDFFMLSFLGQKTKEFWYSTQPLITRSKLKFHEILPVWNYWKSRKKIKVFSRVDYFAPVLEYEYKRIKKMHPRFRAKYIDWNYELGDSIFSNLGKDFVRGNNFLVGNSAAITNNHLDLFELIQEKSLDDQKIYVPLSYGFPKKYKSSIKVKGKEIFGEQFVPMEDFIPFGDYLDTMKSCGFALIGSIRQQALGNIYMCLALGLKVYLHPKNPLLFELRQMGFVLFDLEDFRLETDFSNILPRDIQVHNRELMRRKSKKENYLVKTQNLVKLIQAF
ncbi:MULTISPECIES: TDP-N-acetylfucosamine:lipid II N-acetylfucosaminyltransferase [unclassified Algoriphagus]|jgi:dTDP-N-acetylfucosamine:lipid II N-acetylfucosaminyltransferase|uniref:TDP-N-acetylfucosamine:lipid II N-acetylfucosaminyltransferase n=1 Tax=unclassified Algoriphagus TaxID=2641541 RepID=UPI000C40F063|nr:MULTISPECIES: TDP-N-acetylfucosamine:lipid II N-acetylfucosaminyltransferase [unclassified Algoriphagus]MAL14071.1 hypothetical protein [Algoriphagus sp.]MAN87760.1 hypothetical protein [Algoriphagus sp.]HAD49942.1 hypothetical protein [Algoriphagus sp.]HAS58163.1 hypothetical protein [Algoriphagus sp.]HCH45798.1 hypothetical protein [Algoriphagus sp.]|tara:strand:+ start:2289 stop:3434 length:1146 start_codon:yes stop_codon:yes gene_type:complete